MNARAQISTAKLPDDPIPEAEVLARWPVLAASALRIARHQGKIAWIRGKRGTAWYRAEAVQSYISTYMEQPCRALERHPSSNLEDNGSRTSRAAPISTDIGLSRDLEEHVAKAFARKI